MKLGQYKGLCTKRPNIEVYDKDILNVLLKKQKEYSLTYTIDDRPAQIGDQVILDFDSTLNGKTIPKGRGRDFRLMLGSGKFLPDFENQIIGKLPGDIFDIQVIFPKDYLTEQLRGQSAIFHTVLKKLNRLELQPLDDDFAKDFSNFDTLDEWELDIKQQLEEEKENSAYEKLTKDLMTQIINNSEIEIDEEIRGVFSEELYEEFIVHLSEHNISLEYYCDQTKTTPDDIHSRFDAEATREIQEQQILHAIAIREGFDVSDDELAEELYMLAAEEGEDVDTFCEMLGDEEIDSIADQLRMNKALRLIVSHAVFE